MADNWRDWKTFCGVFIEVGLKPGEVRALCDKHQISSTKRSGQECWNMTVARQLREAYKLNQARKAAQAAMPVEEETIIF